MNQKSLVVCFFALVLMAVSCKVKSSDDVEKEVDDIIAKSQQDIDELTKPEYRGGQPGKVTVKGVLVRKNGDQVELEDRIVLQQFEGRGNRGVSMTFPSEKNKAELIEKADLKSLEKIEDQETYLNFGCTDLKPEDTKGLKEESAVCCSKESKPLKAKKIFICGPQTIAESTVGLIADELILKNASLEIKASTGFISVSANKLHLEGKNVFKTTAPDAQINVPEGLPVDLEVAKEIHGKGMLALQTYGGNCVQPDEKK